MEFIHGFALFMTHDSLFQLVMSLDKKIDILFDHHQIK